MAATATWGRKSCRFSLLLLEDGEVLLSDLAVQYRLIAKNASTCDSQNVNRHLHRFLAKSENGTISGRVKIGTKNIFFDSDDWRDPVFRISISCVDRACLFTDDEQSSGGDHSRVSEVSPPNAGDQETSVLVFAKSGQLQREHGNDHAYIDVHVNGVHSFTPSYTSGQHLLDEIQVLLEINSLSSRRKREERLRDLVAERESKVAFDITLLEHDELEHELLDSSASAVYAIARVPGRFRIYPTNVYLMPIHGESSEAVKRIPIREIRSIRRMRHGCQNAALELGYIETSEENDAHRMATFMVSFPSFAVREKAVEILLSLVQEGVELYNRRELEVALGKWRTGEMSNFSYLMYLNLAAGRSFNDLSQYPVFPWVITDYESDELDLNLPSTFRDLSLPIGALEPKRLAVFSERFDAMPPPRFFYGTHYSTPAYTINYLVRAAPAAMLRLQNGRFDNPDRLFNSISSTWRGVLSNQGDVKELIPEFFAIGFTDGAASGVLTSSSAPGQFLDNIQGLDLGVRQDGKKVADVELPPWAGGSSERFVRRNRDALESHSVSERLHTWIDLIFGVKSGSADAKNVFYTDAALPNSMKTEDISKMTGEEVAQLETVYLEFGRTPRRLFEYPHPPRYGCFHETTDQMNDPTDINDSEQPQLDVETEKEIDKQNEICNTVTDYRTDSHSRRKSFKNAADDDRHLQTGTSWGSHSRRRNSMLSGTGEHVLLSYEPKDECDPPELHSSSMANVIQAHEDRNCSNAILDICIVEGLPVERTDSLRHANDDPLLYTVWLDGHLKIYSETSTIRSKYLGDVSSVVYLSPRNIVYGTQSGDIRVYYVNTGRTEDLQRAAHDAEVTALECVQDLQVIISSSKDASVKVWHFDMQNQSLASLKLVQELDAESSVEDINVCIAPVKRPTSTVDAMPQLLIAAASFEGHLVAWSIPASGMEEDFPEPIWRVECPGRSRKARGDAPRTRVRNLTWLYQGLTKMPALASVHPEDNCLRVWSLDETNMASAEVFLSTGVTACITQAPIARTLVVGGANGQVHEFDGTGLLLGKVIVKGTEVRRIFISQHAMCVYILTGSGKALRLNR